MDIDQPEAKDNYEEPKDENDKKTPNEQNVDDAASKGGCGDMDIQPEECSSIP